jgi:type II secretory pathway pseudopilin PulG
MEKCKIANSDHVRQSGFTLIELSMSLLFIAFIILFLTSTMLSIMQTYNKGVWLNQINQAGRQINADVSGQSRYSKDSISILPEEQRMCIGGVAYLWNTVDSFKNYYVGDNQKDADGNVITKLRFVRILDGKGEFCSNSVKMPDRDDTNISILLGPGSIVKEFKVTEGKIGLLRIQAVFSTEGGDQPQYNEDINHWQCGQIIGDQFVVGKNQFCAFAEFDIIVYRRLGE